MATKKCCICQTTVGFWTGEKILDGMVCLKCFKRRPRYFTQNPKKLSVNQFKELQEYIKTRSTLSSKIRPTTVVAGDQYTIVIDDVNGLFAVFKTDLLFSSEIKASSSPFCRDNNALYTLQKEIDRRLPGIANDFLAGRRKVSSYYPSVFYTNEVISFRTQTEKTEGEITIHGYKSDSDGNMYLHKIYSFTPRCYSVSYNFHIDVYLQNQFESRIKICLNKKYLNLYKNQEDYIEEYGIQAFLKSLKPYAPYGGSRDNDFVVRNSENFVRYSDYLVTLHEHFDKYVAANKIKYCGRCGTKLTGDKRFCPQCGNAIRIK